jgi:hypothetical protein
MKPSGAHTHPELGGSGGGKRWPVILVVVVLTAIAGPAAHVISDLLEALAITVAVVLVVASLAGLLYRVRRRDTKTLTWRGVRVLSAPEPRAVARAQELHLHFHGVGAGDVAAIIARQDEER